MKYRVSSHWTSRLNLWTTFPIYFSIRSNLIDKHSLCTINVVASRAFNKLTPSISEEFSNTENDPMNSKELIKLPYEGKDKLIKYRCVEGTKCRNQLIESKICIGTPFTRMRMEHSQLLPL